ncbi:uncharacterized protein METZ01_LOCUS363638, partial [marine metagenome]
EFDLQARLAALQCPIRERNADLLSEPSQAT